MPYTYGGGLADFLPDHLGDYVAGTQIVVRSLITGEQRTLDTYTAYHGRVPMFELPTEYKWTSITIAPVDGAAEYLMPPPWEYVRLHPNLEALKAQVEALAERVTELEGAGRDG